MPLIDKIKRAFEEKRLLKSIFKKILPYLRGFFLTFLPKKNNIRIHIPSKNIFDKNDLDLASRIFESFKLIKSEQQKKSDLYRPSSMWQDHIDNDFSFMKKSFEDNNLESFLFFLQNFGNWDKYLGIENQTYIKNYSKNFFLKRFLSDEIFYGQMMLWKYFSQSKNIKSLNLPRFGNQNGAYIDENFVVLGSFFTDIYAKTVKNILKKSSENIIVDLGGGYGRFGYYTLKDTYNNCFVDIDIPENLALASYYLSKCFPDKKNFFYGENKFSIETLKNYDLIFLPPWEIENIPDNSTQVVINTNSLGEMEPIVAKNYLKHIHRISKYFFSLNHEFIKNQFQNGKSSLINKEFNLDEKFKVLIRHPDLGHLTFENNTINLDSDIFFYLYEKN